MKRYALACCFLLIAALLLTWQGREEKRGETKSPAGKPVAVSWKAAPSRLRWDTAFSTRLSPPVADFQRWAVEYAGAYPEERPGMLGRGQALARAHRARMKELIFTDPRRALEEAVPMVLRQELPGEITTLLESRVNARGRLDVLALAPGNGGEAGIRRVFTDGEGQRFEASVYGRRAAQRTTREAMVHGVALDGVLALHQDPVRPLEPGERLKAGEPVIESCPVSGEETTLPTPEIPPGTPAVETGGRVLVLCSGGHIHTLNDALTAQEGSTGGPSKPVGDIPASWTTGPKSLLFIRVAFPDRNEDPQSERESYDMLKQVNDFFMENSHNQLYLLSTVTPLITLPKPEAWYLANDTPSADFMLFDARAAAKAAGFDYQAYDLDAVRYNGGSGNFSGQAYVGERGVWLKKGTAGLACHELGHNLGLWHANSWNTGGESVTGPGSNCEYGNSFDCMGASNAGNSFFNAGHQTLLHWIPEENVTRVTGSGLYRIYQFDQARLEAGKSCLLAVKKDARRNYWCELRQRWTQNPWLTDGLTLNWSPWGDNSSAGALYGSNGGSQLLDTTPGSPDDREDSPLVLGHTFADPGSGIYITPVAKGHTVPESMDVVVQTGTFPGNQPPALLLSPATATVEVNAPVTFTAAAADPDGDALAYAWEWGDRSFGPNAATATRSWAQPGIYTVRCEVSDMKGGTRSALAVVTVGQPGTFTVSGRVLTDAGEPLAGVRVHNGAAGTLWRGCATDSAGNYTLGGMGPALYSLAALSETHVLTGARANPVDVQGDVTGVDFTATPRAGISMTLLQDTCAEGGAGATLRFARVGVSNAGSLEARVFLGGSAALSDVVFTPAEVYQLSTYKFTIPDGRPWLDVFITAFNDTLPEGPEQMTFHLLAGTGYLPSGPDTATLNILDNDTDLPVVSVEAAKPLAVENGEGGMLRFSRTGPATNPLTVPVTRGGNATPEVDYTGVGTAVTIPAGQASLEVPVTALPDTVVEGTETATFTLATDPAYLRSPQKSSASLVILDAAIPTVTVTAADDTASEENRDPAVFIVTRTGDTSLPLTVDYALGGTAEHGTDYISPGGVVTIPAGQASASIVIVPVDDAIGEPPQTVIVQLRSGPRYLTGPEWSATATILDNDVPDVSVTVSNGLCTESGHPGVFRIQTSGSGPGTVEVRYLLSGTATQGTDYAALPGSIMVPRDGFGEVVIAPLADGEPEDVESVTLTLLPDPGYHPAPERAATLFLVDDARPAVSVTAEMVDLFDRLIPAGFYFSRMGPAAGEMVVEYLFTGTALPGVDYIPPSGSLTIPAGAAGARLDVPLLAGLAIGGTRSLVCTVVPHPGLYGTGASPATAWLRGGEDPEGPRVSFTEASSSWPESVGTVSVSVRLSAPAAAAVRVDYAFGGGQAFNGADYLATAGTLLFAPGETERFIPVTIVDDPFIEPAESLSLRLLRVAGARAGTPATHVLTILDNDTPPPPLAGFTTATSTTPEGGTPAGPLVFLSAPQGQLVNVQWAVTGGTAPPDFLAAPSGMLTFLPGETVKPLPLVLPNDNLPGPSKTLVFTLGAATGGAGISPGNASTVLTITDDDPPLPDAFAVWRGLHFPGTADPAITGPHADPDNDGLENLVEYALGSDPNLPDPAPAPGASSGGDTLGMVWRQSTTAADVLIEPQWSGDLVTWESTGLTVTTTASGEGWVEKRATLPSADHPRAGMRLLVTMP